MDWLAAVDIYCERTGPGFWAEPANALSNAAFVLASLWGALTARRLGNRAADAWMLIGLAAAIGLGSFLFHTLAVRWSELADTVPIWTFVAGFVLVAMHRLGGMEWGRVALWAVLVGGAAVATISLLATGEGATTATPALPDPLNGSGQYAPAVLALAVFALVTRRRLHPAAPWIAGCLAIFLVSLTFRTLDRDFCPALPLGLHFLWHLLNGLMIGLMLQMLLRTGYPPRR